MSSSLHLLLMSSSCYLSLHTDYSTTPLPGLSPLKKQPFHHLNAENCWHTKTCTFHGIIFPFTLMEQIDHCCEGILLLAQEATSTS
jgi:hypothetical protein